MFRKWAIKGGLAGSLALVCGALYVDDVRTNPFKYRVQSAVIHLDAWYFDRIHGERKRQLFASMGNGKVLELGPGAGHNFRYIPKGVDWSGVDINPKFTDTIMHHAAREGFPPIVIQLKTGDLREHLKSLADNSLDAILTTKVLCCFKDVDVVLSDINRVLKPGGRLYFVECNPLSGPLWALHLPIAPDKFLTTGVRFDTNVVEALHKVFQEVYVENWPGSVDPMDPRAGIRKVSYSPESGVSSMKGTIVNQCVVAGICTKAGKKTTQKSPFRPRLT